VEVGRQTPSSSVEQYSSLACEADHTPLVPLKIFAFKNSKKGVYCKPVSAIQNPADPDRKILFIDYRDVV
jgi:hypothetical protein